MNAPNRPARTGDWAQIPTGGYRPSTAGLVLISRQGTPNPIASDLLKLGRERLSQSSVQGSA